MAGSDAGKDLASAASKAEWAANVDLNKVSDEVALKAKSDMDETFRRTAIQKDDPNFVYDKQVDFGDADEDSGWD